MQLTTSRGAASTPGTARRVALAAATALTALWGASCASPGTPPGGPPDKAPPKLLSVAPESGSLNVRASSVLLRFDEVVNERSTPASAIATGSSSGSGSGGIGGGFGGGGGGYGGGSGGGSSTLGSLVVLSPGDGRERVTWRRTAIEIEPRGGFRPNTTYRVTLLPGLSDLRGNVLREQQEIVFSTGDSRPEGEIAGVVFDWAAGRIALSARVEIFAGSDSTLRWTTRADSTGRFLLRDLPAGSYHLRAWVDANGNRTIDARELFDSVTVALATRADAELYAFVHDTVGPRLETVEPQDSTELRIRFDRSAAVDWTPDSSTLLLQRSDSSVIRIGVMIPATRFDSVAQAAAAVKERVRADSAAKDTTAKGTITRPALASDTVARVKAPALSRPIPVQNWVAVLDAPLPPGEYRIAAGGIRGLAGAARRSERVFRIRPPAAPKDTAAAKPKPPGL